MSWGSLFDRAEAIETTPAAIRETLSKRRARPSDDETADSPADGGTSPPEEAAPTRVVADADVLAADLLVGETAREAVDAVREHSWLELVTSEPLLTDAARVIETLSDADLAADWTARVREDAVLVEHPGGDHPGLASAYRGGAAHLLSLDEDLGSARTGLSVQPHLSVSVRPPAAFAAVFDAAALYEAEVGDDYPGPDRDPRA